MALRKKIKWMAAAICLLLIFTINSCATFRKSDKNVYRKFKKASITPSIYKLDFNGKNMRYIASKPINSALPTILFVHGAPGSSDNYYEHLQDTALIRAANLIAVDRLGYGYSNYGKAETSLQTQAESIYAIIKKHQLQNVTLVGWSFGGPIIVKMAANYTEIKHLLLIAPAISPKDEKFFGIGKIVHWKATRWLFSKALRVSDEEKFSHVEELNKLLSDWKKINIPIHYYHGDKDKIVPYANMEFIKQQVADSLLKITTIAGGSHFIIFKNYEQIQKDLLAIIQE